MDSGINRDRNTRRNIKKDIKVTAGTINGFPHRIGEEKQFRNGKWFYGTIKDNTIIMSFR
jgi:hypothetical protein